MGYIGECGYELFVCGQDVGMIWDCIFEEGVDLGIIFCCFIMLDMLWVESYLLFFFYDNFEMYFFDDQLGGDMLWELGLDFIVSFGKQGFCGVEEYYCLKGCECFKIWGFKFDGKNVFGNGVLVFKDGQKVGVVMQVMYLFLNDWIVVIVCLFVDCVNEGIKLIVNCVMYGEIVVIIVVMFFFDFDKKCCIVKG